MTRERPPGAQQWVPDDADLTVLREAVHDCRGCGLYELADQAVFGEGPEDPALMLVGEQPGDREDREGHPFVGPAGRVLDDALAEVEVDRSTVYVTNAVKHFKFTHRASSGKRRIHQKPNQTEITACNPWLRAELARLRPEVVVGMGATAATALLGRGVRLTEQRGRRLALPVPEGDEGDEDRRAEPPPTVVLTVHPSSVLRAPDRKEAYRGLVRDLRAAAKAYTSRSSGS